MGLKAFAPFTPIRPRVTLPLMEPRKPGLSALSPDLAKQAESLGMDATLFRVGLGQALDEMGPNPLTEFADGLEIEGHPKPPGGHFPMWESIGRFRDALTEFLQGKDHAFIGGVAARSYAARGVPTKDFDVLVDVRHLKEFTSFLEADGARLAGTVEDTYAFRIPSLGFDFDVRVARSGLDQEALSKAKGASYAGRKLRIVAPEHLAAMKVKAYSERKDSDKGRLDASDIRGLLAVGATTEEAIRAVLEKHRPDLLPELDEVLSSAR